MWTFSQSDGRITKEGVGILATGYSGRDEAKNNSAMEQVKDRGPIPRGRYTIGPPRDTHTHGPYVLPLTPDADNEMWGRGEFLIHGDNIELPGRASEGCIILPRFARERIWESGDHDLQVVAELEMTA